MKTCFGLVALLERCALLSLGMVGWDRWVVRGSVGRELGPEVRMRNSYCGRHACSSRWPFRPWGMVPREKVL